MGSYRTTDAVVVGGGVVGLTAALALAASGRRVEVIDGGKGCSPHAAAMLAPRCELDHAPPAIAAAGADSVARWTALLGDRADGVLSPSSSWLVAHAPERALLDHLHRRIARAGGDDVVWHARDRLTEVAPTLGARFDRALEVPGEGSLVPPDALRALRDLLPPGSRRTARAIRLDPGRVTLADGDLVSTELVVDARGLEASGDLPLRGVRGEYLVLGPADVPLPGPVRLLHPRYPLYAVPRPDGTTYVGATMVERDEDAPPTARAALELLSALVSVHPAFAEAEILTLGAARRPATADHLPVLAVEPGRIRVNGLFRHGWLLSPRMAAAVVALADGSDPGQDVASFVREA